MINKEIKVNVSANMLLIGPAATSYGYKEINYEDDPDDVRRKYGDSLLADAFELANTMGVKDVFVMNLQKKQDYIDVIDTIKQNDFAFIVPLNLMLSDTFRDPYDLTKSHNYYAYLLGSMGNYHESVFLVTDKHASLYENLDAFLDDMEHSIQTFKNCCTPFANMENIVFVGNDLSNYEYANLMLAIALCTTPLNQYPTTDFGPSVFNIDWFDVTSDCVYFKNHSRRETTVENLVNALSSGPEKVVHISRIIKHLRRTIDFSEFRGKLYSDYIKLQIAKKLEEYLSNFKGYIINDFRINSVEAYKDVPGTVVIVCRYEVYPVNCLETVSLEATVEV